MTRDKHDGQPVSRNVVIKIGSAVLTRPDLRLDRAVFTSLIAEVAALAMDGHRVTIVSSGAVAMGRHQMGLEKRPRGRASIPRLQALAAIGQSRLMHTYEAELAHYEIQAAQVLLTRADIHDRGRYLNARHTLEALHHFGAMPVVNENDTIAADEIRFGDNDQLAALVVTMVRADTLVLLSDIDALYTADPRTDVTAVPIREIQVDDPALDSMAGDTFDHVGGVGSGGMVTKILAARIASRVGATTIIAPGKQPGVVADVLREAGNVGSRLLPSPVRPIADARKVWIDVATRSSGRIRCDGGAARAVGQQNKSLLPSGITAVDGDFAQGDAIELVDPSGQVFARGLAIYDAESVRAIAGRQSSEIEGILGYKILDAVVHRDDLVLVDVAIS